MRKEAIKGEVFYADEIEEAITSLREQQWIDNNALFLVAEAKPLSWNVVDEKGEVRFTIKYHATLGLQINYTEK